jgi:hypothetical protein
MMRNSIKVNEVIESGYFEIQREYYNSISFRLNGFQIYLVFELNYIFWYQKTKIGNFSNQFNYIDTEDVLEIVKNTEVVNWLIYNLDLFE